MTRQTATQTQQQTPTSSLLSRGGILQRKCESCGNHTIAGGVCAECAKNTSGLQRKLAIGASNDPLEREADRVADQVMSAPSHLAVSDSPPRIQRFTGQATGQADMAAPASVDRVLSSPGSPLEPALQQDMEQRFGYDFSRVRIHTDAAAERSAREVNANAYTVKHDIVFGASRFSPGTHEGRRLIAHELTHVIQQSGSPITSSTAPEIGEPDNANERETDMQAAGAASFAPHRLSSSQELRVQRSFVSGLLDVLLFIPRLFGLEVFTADDLRDYLSSLRQRKGPEDGIFSDNKARACVSRENEFGPYDAQTKIWLIQEMLGGHTSFLDEGAIITLLRRSQPDIGQIVSAIGRERLWSKFGGNNRQIIEAMTLTAADAGDALVSRLRNLDPSQIQVYAANATDPAVRESIRQAAALANMTAPVPAGAAITPSGEANFTINGVRVIVRQDQIKPALGQHAFTTGNFEWRPPGEVIITPGNANQPVGPFDPVDISMTVWTEFPSEEAKRKPSGYGVGTRPQDEHTLQYHERAHGEGWFNFLRNNQPPVFTGTSSMLPAQFNAALQQWKVSMRDYAKRAGDYALRAGDCVGTLPTDEQLAGTGFTAAICRQE